ncbi:MAG: TIGR00730 family Rossman fold protein [bacterium]|nr:TIGR00730 family Rossman fold protein [bacterium]
MDKVNARDEVNNLLLTKEEMREIASKRNSEIQKEFTNGFDLLENYPRSVTFFGSTQTDHSNVYYKDARVLAHRIAKELGYSVITGGGPGIMEAANRGAHEVGGNSLGLTIKLPLGQRTNKYIDKEIEFYYFFVRKVCLTFSAEAFIFYPGGFGTLDEFFEVATLIQTKKIEGVPIICVGVEYWSKLTSFMETEMLSRGAISLNDLGLFAITDDHETILEIIKKAPVKTGMLLNKHSPLHGPVSQT